MATAAADQLLGVLNLFGFNQSDRLSPALAAACADDKALRVVQWLAENLRAEHFTTSLLTAASATPYVLTEDEQATANDFASSLRLPACVGLSGEPDAVTLGARERSAKLLAQAAEGLKQRDGDAEALHTRQLERLAPQLTAVRQAEAQQAESLDITLQTLEKLASQLVGLLCGALDEEKLLSLQEILEFQDSDKALMESITTFYRAQFCEAPEHQPIEQGWMQDATARGRSRLLSCDDSPTVAARGMELERLRLSHGAALEAHARTRALQGKHEKALEALRGGLTRPELTCQDAAMLCSEADKQQVYLDRVLERKRQLLEDELPQLCASLGSLQGLDVVKADLDMELARNKYYAQKKTLVLDLLVARMARVAALVMASKQEVKAILDTDSVLQAAEEELNGVSQHITARLANLQAVKDTGALRPEAPTSVSKAPTAAAAHERRAAFEQELHEALSETIPNMQAACGNLHALLFSSASFEDPVLTPLELSEARGKLTELVQELHATADIIFQQQSEYNRILQAQRSSAGRERNVFHQFYKDPQALLAEVAKLEKAARK